MNRILPAQHPQPLAELEFLNTHNNMALVSQFEISADIEQVWRELTHPEQWPQWWPYVESVELLEAGDANDLNALRKVRWKTALPYQIDLSIRTLIIEKPYHIVVAAKGD